MTPEKLRDNLIELISRKQDYGITYTQSQMDDRKVYQNVTLNSTITDYLIENDVFPVVRCKDCRYYTPYPKPVEDFDGHCDCYPPHETDENEYCSYGVRRD